MTLDLGALTRKYPFVRALGVGGQGAVYLSQQGARPVVVKVLTARDDEGRLRFEREALLMERITHPSVAPLVDHGCEGGWLYQVTEYQEGETLRKVLDAAAPLALPEAVAIARELASALAAVHAAGIVHRDVKPENVIVTRSGLRLIDFGLGLDPDLSRLTATGSAVGSPSHAAPEMILAQTIGPAADLYALGVVLVELVTGENPFVDPESLPETIQRHLNLGVDDDPALMQRIPAPLRELVRALLQKQPGLRPASAQVVADQLATLPRTAEAPRPRRAPRRPSALRWRWPAATLASLFCFLSSWFALSPRAKPVAPATTAPPPAVRLDRLDLNERGCALRAHVTCSAPVTARVAWEPGPTAAEVALPGDATGVLPLTAPAGARQFRVEVRSAGGGAAHTPWYEVCLSDVLRAAAHRVGTAPSSGLSVDDLLKYAYAAGATSFTERLERRLDQLPAMQVRESLQPYLAGRSPFDLPESVVPASAVLKVVNACSALGAIRYAARGLKQPESARLLALAAFPGTQQAEMPAAIARADVFTDPRSIFATDVYPLSVADLDNFRVEVTLPPGDGRLFLGCHLRAALVTNGFIQVAIEPPPSTGLPKQVAYLYPLPGAHQERTYLEVHPALARIPRLTVEFRFNQLPLGAPVGKLVIGPAAFLRAQR